MTQKDKPDVTFVVADIMRHLATAELKALTLSREKYVKFKSRDNLVMVGRRCRLAIKDLMELLSPESQKILNGEELNVDVFLQIDGIVKALYAMPAGIRDEIEDCVMARYKVYAMNDKKQAA